VFVVTADAAEFPHVTAAAKISITPEGKVVVAGIPV